MIHKNINIHFFTTLIVLGLLLILGNSLSAQINERIKEKAQTELQDRGISEAEVEKRLREMGFNPDNISPEELPDYEAALEKIINDLEREAAENPNATKLDAETAGDLEAESKVNEKIVQKSEEIQERVKEGASVEEAVSEETTQALQDQAVESQIFGHQVFKNSEITLYRATDNISTPDTYILSSGDIVKVSIFGPGQGDFEFTINQEGYIQPSSMEKIFLKNLSIKEARALTMRRFSQRYRFLPEQFTFTLHTARSVTVSLFGEVRQPGSYTISAINTGFNALVAAGGPKISGSVRKIQLIKGNGTKKILDVYEYISGPKVQFDYPIDDKDIIFVPLSGNIISIEGAVRRPMSYELIEGETLEDAIEYAGGLREDAYNKLIQVSRLGENERVLIDVPLQEYLNSELEFDLQNGDVITVRKVPDRLSKYVRINGAVLFPGNYAYEAGMNLQTLIDKGQLRDDTRRDIAFLFRTEVDGTVTMDKLNMDSIDASNFMLQERDRISFYGQNRYVDTTMFIGIRGAVRNPDTLRFDPGDKIRVSDLILLTGGLTRNAHPEAIVMRINRDNAGDRIYDKINVFNAISDTSSADNILLKQGDNVLIYTNERYNTLGSVSLVGQVRSPVTARYDPSLTLEKLMVMSGGLLENANNTAIVKRKTPGINEKVEYIRLDIEDAMNGDTEFELRRDDEIRIYNKNTFLDAFDVKILGEVNNPGSYKYDESLTIPDMVYMSGGLTLKASTNKVEVYRVDFTENEPTRILVQELDLERDSYDRISVRQNVQLEPFDIVVIRPIPDFKLQEVVYINGEVIYPGPYILSSKDDKIKDVVNRAGGLSDRAFPKGATLIRKNGIKKGLITIDLEKALAIGNKHDNLVLRNGDIVFIPKIENVVSIRVAGTLASEEIMDTTIENNEILMAYQGKKSAAWYVKNYAGGFDKDTDKGSVRVIEQNGRIKATNTYLWFIHDYPSVTEGSTIVMDQKKPRELRRKEQKSNEPVNWQKVIVDSIALVTSVLTILVLAQRID